MKGKKIKTRRHCRKAHHYLRKKMLICFLVDRRNAVKENQRGLTRGNRSEKVFQSAKSKKKVDRKVF